MSGKVFFIKEEDELIEIDEEALSYESHLQDLLYKYPNLLPGDQIDPSSPRRWLAISKEEGLPDDENSANRWSVDFLLLDQDGIPTLVECKRSKNPQLRREVVGQLLEYAANARHNWEGDKLRIKFEELCENQNENPEEKLADFLGQDNDIEKFWNDVDTNLHAGKLRLIFVADQIPEELKKIVEFLNQQMDQAEVFAVEIKQYSRDKLRILVPKVYGRKNKTIIPSGAAWDEKSFFDKAKESLKEKDLEKLNDLYNFAKANGIVAWGGGAKEATFGLKMHHPGFSKNLFTFFSTGRIDAYIGEIVKYKYFGNEVGKWLANELKKIGVEISPNKDLKRAYPTFNLTELDDEQISDFKKIISALLERCK
ncbi:MAG: hypothetical protein NUV68_04875 [Caldiserica bacterium]|jgi:hypothetical protein|nr:hypothetical protein [Caldisericota bacterium]MDH7562665.1 hypothetical protein [Caldisericota bacterium]